MILFFENLFEARFKKILKEFQENTKVFSKI